MRVRTVLALLFVVGLTGACLGLKAREHALIPPMKLAWSNVQKDVEAGITALNPTPEIVTQVTEAKDGMTAALDSGERLQVIKVNWSLLRQFALAGVQDRVNRGEIGPGVGVSRVERIDNFDESFRKLLVQ